MASPAIAQATPPLLYTSKDLLRVQLRNKVIQIVALTILAALCAGLGCYLKGSAGLAIGLIALVPLVISTCVAKQSRLNKMSRENFMMYVHTLGTEMEPRLSNEALPEDALLLDEIAMASHLKTEQGNKELAKFTNMPNFLFQILSRLPGEYSDMKARLGAALLPDALPANFEITSSFRRAVTCCRWFIPRKIAEQLRDHQDSPYLRANIFIYVVQKLDLEDIPSFCERIKLHLSAQQKQNLITDLRDKVHERKWAAFKSAISILILE